MGVIIKEEHLESKKKELLNEKTSYHKWKFNSI